MPGTRAPGRSRIAIVTADNGFGRENSGVLRVGPAPMEGMGPVSGRCLTGAAWFRSDTTAGSAGWPGKGPPTQQSAGDQAEPAEQSGIVRQEVVQATQVAPGNQEQVHRRLGLYVIEGDDLVVGINELRRNRSGGNPTEEALVHVTTVAPNRGGAKKIRGPPFWYHFTPS